MKASGVNHIAIAVRDLGAARETFSALLGSQPSEVVEVAEQQVQVCFFTVGQVKIELICPTADNVEIQRFLDTRGGGLHHICLNVDNLDLALQELKQAGIRLIDEIPRVGAAGKRIAFVHPKSAAGVLIELEEE